MPKCIFPSVTLLSSLRLNRCLYVQLVGRTIQSDGMEVDDAAASRFVGQAQLGYRRDDVEIQWPFTSDGLYRDWEALADLWSHSFRNQLKLNLEEHPLLFCEPSRLTESLREKLVETIFESYATPAVFLAKHSVLSSFASGRQTSLVVDCGYAGSTGDLQQKG